MSRPRVFARLLVGAVGVLVLVGFAGSLASSRLAERQAVNDAAKTADLLADTVIQPALRDALLTGDPAARASIGDAVRSKVLGDSIVRVKIWDPTGRILYSDQPALIGESFPLEADEAAVLTHPTTRADVSDLQRPENRFERGMGRMLQVYRPVWTPSGQPLLFETYSPYDEVAARADELWRGFAGVTLSSLLLLVTLLLPVVWGLLGRLRRAASQRELLLQRTVDAGDAERRRIAGSLHDGVVQELAGTSFRVSAAAEEAAVLGHTLLAADLRMTARTVRNSIGSLRSLLVDIYPPNLESAGLPAALTDLATSLRARGVGVRIELADGATSTLTGDQGRAVFRVVQECLLNAAKHSSAQTVLVGLQRDEEGSRLDVIDDGVGFDAGDALAHPVDGHFGLRVLGDVASASGAVLRVASAPGAGTHWQMRIPQP
ncbi:MAG: sensor histidine kinase [Oryzihumus sp.]